MWKNNLTSIRLTANAIKNFNASIVCCSLFEFKIQFVIRKLLVKLLMRYADICALAGASQFKIHAECDKNTHTYTRRSETKPNYTVKPDWLSCNHDCIALKIVHRSLLVHDFTACNSHVSSRCSFDSNGLCIFFLCVRSFTQRVRLHGSLFISLLFLHLILNWIKL